RRVAVGSLVANRLGLAPSINKPVDLVATVIDQKPIEDDPPPVNYTGDPTQKDVLPPRPGDAAVETDDQGAITAKLVRPDELQIGERPIEPVRQNLLSVRQDPAHPLTQPDYPAAMIRSSTEGVVEVE